MAARSLQVVIFSILMFHLLCVLCNIIIYFFHSIAVYRCPECFNSITSQRNLDILKLDDNVEVKSYNRNGETVEIQCELEIFRLSYLITITIYTAT